MSDLLSVFKNILKISLPLLCWIFYVLHFLFLIQLTNKILVIFIYLQAVENIVDPDQKLGPSIKGLVTDGNAKLCCYGFVLVLFPSTKAYRID